MLVPIKMFFPMAYKKILILCPYPENTAPSQRLKFEQYYDYFRAEGYELTISPFISPSFWDIIYKKGYFHLKLIFTLTGYFKRINDVLRAARYDIIYVHLWVTPFGPPFFEWLLRKCAAKIIYDIDDLVYLNNVESKAHPFVSYIKGRKKPIFLMKTSDHVVTCTPYLDEFVRKYNQNTTDISSTVDTDRYKPVNDYSNERAVTLGWSGSISTSKYFYLLTNVLKRLKEKYSFSIKVIGDKNVKIEGLDVKALSWNEKTEVQDLQQIDVGLYPLPDEQWVYGKSGLKAIQYMALGIPTVATAIGANFRVIDNEINGFLVKTEEDWFNQLSMLIEDASLRKKLGTAARKKVENKFSLHANAPIYLGILNKV